LPLKGGISKGPIGRIKEKGSITILWKKTVGDRTRTEMKRRGCRVVRESPRGRGEDTLEKLRELNPKTVGDLGAEKIFLNTREISWRGVSVRI